MHFLRHHGCRCVGAHPARIGAGISLTDGLVVLGRRDAHHVFPIGKARNRRFLTFQVFHQHQLVTRGAELPVHQHPFDGTERLIHRVAHQRTLSGSQSRGFQNNRRSPILHEPPRGVRVGECSILPGGNAIFVHDAEREVFIGLNPGRPPRGPEHPEAHGLEPVRKPVCERVLGPDDRQIDTLPLSKSHQTVQIVHTDIHAGGLFGHTGVAGSGINTTHLRTLGDLPRKRVLAASLAHNQHFHLSGTPCISKRGRSFPELDCRNSAARPTNDSSGDSGKTLFQLVFGTMPD